MEPVLMQRLDPKLRELVAEAARALAQLDADRLEELALSCRMLCDGQHHTSRQEAEMYRQAQEASREMALFGGVLDATRANIRVLKQLRNSRGGVLGYEGHS